MINTYNKVKPGGVLALLIDYLLVLRKSSFSANYEKIFAFTSTGDLKVDYFVNKCIYLKSKNRDVRSN